LTTACTDADPSLRAIAWRTAGQLGRTDLLPSAQLALGDPDAATRFEAAHAAVRLGDREAALTSLRTLAEVAGPHREAALMAVLLQATATDSHALLKTLSTDPNSLRLRVRGAGWSGDPFYVPWLLQQMASPALARVAGESLSLITGLDLAEHDLEGPSLDPSPAGLNDDPNDDDVAIDEDESLPWPHTERVALWWQENCARFEPGTRYRFSTYGWILLSAVVEAAAKEPLRAFLTREILDPLGMASTVVDDGAEVPEITSFYIPRATMQTKLGVRKVSRTNNSCLAGAGAFFSTPSDMVRFGSAMLKPGLLKADTIALLETPLRLQSGASTDFALGWKIERVQMAGESARMVAHRATPNGSTIALLLFPDQGVVVAAASNIAPGQDVDATCRTIAEAFAIPDRK